jgi:hypothetical protein
MRRTLKATAVAVALAALAEPGAAAGGVAPAHPALFARLRGGNAQPKLGHASAKGGRKGAFNIAVSCPAASATRLPCSP